MAIQTPSLKRKYPEEQSTEGSHACKMLMFAAFPSYLSNGYAKFHQLTIEDRKSQLQDTDGKLLILWSLAQNSELTQAALSTQNKSALIDKLISATNLATDGINKLICPYDIHIPKLPVHLLQDERIFQQLQSGNVLLWQGAAVRCVGSFHGYALMERLKLKTNNNVPHKESPVVKKSKFTADHSGPFVLRLGELVIGGQIYDRTDDMFLIQTAETHSRLSTMASHVIKSLENVA